jgi:hypothetical protein
MVDRILTPAEKMERAMRQLEAERDQLRGENERLREVVVAAWTDLSAGEPGEAVANQLWKAVVSAVAEEELGPLEEEWEA